MVRRRFMLVRRAARGYGWACSTARAGGIMVLLAARSAWPGRPSLEPYGAYPVLRTGTVGIYM